MSSGSGVGMTDPASRRPGLRDRASWRGVELPRVGFELAASPGTEAAPAVCAASEVAELPNGLCSELGARSLPKPRFASLPLGDERCSRPLSRCCGLALLTLPQLADLSKLSGPELGVELGGPELTTAGVSLARAVARNGIGAQRLWGAIVGGSLAVSSI
ncbi:MAG: hypothetical protein R3C56_27125 [Pirellulaceae bacterium]